MNHLYEFTMRISPGNGTEMPDGIIGAYVACYAAASDCQAALRKGALTITQMGYKFYFIKNDVREVPIESWGTYLDKVWPEYIDQMPSVAQLPEVVKDGQIFFGPFVGFSG
jgi:hypothetical protein